MRSDHAIAQALVALLDAIPEENLPAVCDRALTLVSESGGDVKTFARLVRTALEKSGKAAFAILTTPTGAVGDAHKASLTDTLTKRLGRTVILTEEADPSLIGGARLKVGDELFELSLQEELLRIVPR